MKHYHAIRVISAFGGELNRKMVVFNSKERELTLDDVVLFEGSFGLNLYQSFYIGYGDDSILDKYRGLGLI